MAVLVAVLIMLVVTGLAIVASRLLLRRLGIDLSTLPPEKRRPMLAMYVALVVQAVVIAVAFATDHAGLGIAAVVAVFVVFQLVLTFLRFRRARRT